MKKFFILFILVLIAIDSILRILGMAGGLLSYFTPNDIVVRPELSICLHHRPNYGSNQSLILYTYNCGQVPDWNQGNNGETPPLVLDSAVTTECPILSHNSDIEFEDLIKVKQDRLCKQFAHPTKDDTEEMFVIENTGKIRKAEIVR